MSAVMRAWPSGCVVASFTGSETLGKGRYSEHLEGDGAAIFALACGLGAEGIVSKHREHPYRAGPSKAWLKVKNPAAPGVLRFEDRT
jgi:ATP-dependent DNA ligase